MTTGAAGERVVARGKLVNNRQENLEKAGARLVVDGEASVWKLMILSDCDITSHVYCLDVNMLFVVSSDSLTRALFDVLQCTPNFSL